jgi:photosystem II stability/assembly factor-like uncharacterized protein
MERPILLSAIVLLLALPVAGQSDSVEVEHAVPARLAPRSLLLDAASAGERLIVVGERGHVLLSDDAAASWRQVDVPTRAMLTGVFFHDDRLGWAVGHDAVILRTQDGGESWERVHYAPEEERPLLDVWFRDPRNGFAIGAYGFLLSTADGGESWTSQMIGAPPEEDDEFALGDDLHLNHVARSAAGRLYIAAEAGTVYRSDDDGESWLSLPSPYEGSFFGTLPLEGDSLLLFGLRGHLYRSEDAGQSWRELDSHTEAMLTGGLVLDDGTVLLAGLAGTLLVSRDGGREFELQEQADRQGLSALLQASDGGLVLVGEFGVTKLEFSVQG